MLWVLTAARGVRKARAMTIERFVVLTGGLAGFHPSKRQPRPGTETLWQGARTLAERVLAIRTWEGIRMQGDGGESSV